MENCTAAKVRSSVQLLQLQNRQNNLDLKTINILLINVSKRMKTLRKISQQQTSKEPKQNILNREKVYQNHKFLLFFIFQDRLQIICIKLCVIIVLYLFLIFFSAF